MSIKIYNNKQKKWEKASTMLASSIKVLDVNGDFIDIENTITDDNTNENNQTLIDVETCLIKLSNDIKAIKQELRYIREYIETSENQEEI